MNKKLNGEYLNLGDLVRGVSARIKCPVLTTDEMVRGVFGYIEDRTREGEIVKIPGFGFFTAGEGGRQRIRLLSRREIAEELPAEQAGGSAAPLQA